MTSYAIPIGCPTIGGGRRWKRHKKLRLESDPAKPLPAVRQRALTPPLPPAPAPRAGIFPFRKGRRTHEQERDHDQKQSPFFAKLPREVRTLIYREVLAPKDHPGLHVASADARLLSRRCRDDSWAVLGWRHPCWGGYHKKDGTTGPTCSGGGYKPEEDSPYATRMGIIQSCRRIYAESIDILYSDNVIDFRQTRTVSEFGRSILPHRLHRVRFLHLALPLDIYWYSDTIKACAAIWPLDMPFFWEEAWETIPRFKSLQRLRVSLSYRKYGDEPELGALVKLMKSMVPIKVPEYVVDLNWPVEVDKLVALLGNEVPFEIRFNDLLEY
ncbi:hypothetical protein P168DRAFT_285562 [Aspergillus campestris IBT 28561]|uniref:DUF7730 domain-containing protein n=1 Tax=Aspergillus campestris (strain IBT 28561) TaxID=1392248 RepID=A0A2I1CR05_ASPC2|nr:uncharacterized protein P168DRAFT_285562 [Aspergillus campestris IBT 28561]PKY00047.1 hypothetical protein P168DRAFT_285562 [Aspergillus campestris IBT 28561]